MPQETLNFWKQIPHVMKYFRKEEDPTARLPKNFMSGFLEVRMFPRKDQSMGGEQWTDLCYRAEIRWERCVVVAR